MREEFVEPDPVLRKKMKLKGEKGKVEKVKETASEKKEDVQEKMGEKKEEMGSKMHEIKEGASEKKEEIKEDLGEAKEEVKKKKAKLEKESEEEGRTPGEKLLNDIVKKFRKGSEQINETISDYTEESAESKKRAEKPLVDILETNDTFKIIADISGLKKDDIDIGISKNSVEITAIYKEVPEDSNFVQKERCYGKTHRKIKLSKEIKVSEAKANYKNCTLTITLPKTVEDITKVDIEE